MWINVYVALKVRYYVFTVHLLLRYSATGSSMSVAFHNKSIGCRFPPTGSRTPFISGSLTLNLCVSLVKSV